MAARLNTSTGARCGLTRGRATPAAALALAAVAVGVGDLVLGDYQIQLLSQAFIFAIAAVSLDVVWGYTGIPDLGHAVWFGIGALAVGAVTVTVSSTGLSAGVHGGFLRYTAGLVLGVVIAAALAGVVGRFSFFSSSAAGSQFYIAIVTLALATAATTVYTQVSWTGGENGLSGFELLSVSGSQWYFLTAGLMLLAAAGAYVLVRSDFGLVMRAIRDNERRARYLAVNVEAVKTGIFMLGAAGAALAGGVYGLSVGLVSASLFSFLLATELLVWVAVGGRATIIGPVIGAVAMNLIGAQLNQSFPSQWTLAEGAIFVAVVVFMPDGAFPYLAHAVRRISGDRLRAPGRTLVASAGHRPAEVTGEAAVSVRDLRFSYGELHVLRGVDLDVRPGELLCVVGPNGAGKSTLMEVMTDGTRKHRGSITYHLGRPLGHHREPPHRIARAGAIRKFQIPSLFGSLTVAESLLLACRQGRLPSIWRRSAEVPVSQPVLDIIEVAGLAGRENTLASELSHGLAQGLEIAMAVAADPGVLILDEPTAGLTAGERELIGQILRRLVHAGMSIVLIEHDLDFVQRVADRVAVLHEGRVLETGTPAEVSASPVVRNAYVGMAAS